MRRTWLWPAMMGLLALAQPTPSRAAVPDTLTRPLGMGEAFRAHGAGNGALYFNPSTMSLIRTYSVEAAYLNLDGLDVFSGSVVDTKTSALGAGVAYSYVPVADGSDDHDVRVGLSTALVPELLTVGILGQHTWLGETDETGLSLDVGTTLFLARTVGLGFVIHNLMPAEEVGENRHFGLGLAYVGLFTAAFDAVLDPEQEGADAFSYHGGLEYLVSQSFPLRVGYEAMPVNGAHHLSIGLGALSPQAGVQVSFRQRLDESDEQVLAVSLNLFL